MSESKQGELAAPDNERDVRNSTTVREQHTRRVHEQTRHTRTTK
jgi:hypothetical protein